MKLFCVKKKHGTKWVHFTKDSFLGRSRVTFLEDGHSQGLDGPTRTVG